MPALTIELPEAQAKREFNLRRWAELLVDPVLAKFEGRIETDRHGHVVMSPPPAPNHGSLQSEIGHLLRTLQPQGRVLTECPISTADGIKAADVAWASRECMRKLGNRTCFGDCPELCVEVFSPGNTEIEIREKMMLYFDAGAREVWLCAESGAMRFFGPNGVERRKASKLCPRFPKQVVLSP